jgi:hypothetical protein
MRQPYPPSISPDDDVFLHLAVVYASNHPTMHLGYPCNNMDREFQGGITNGAAWYPLTGKSISTSIPIFISRNHYVSSSTNLLYFK